MKNKRLLLFLLFVLFYGIRAVAWTTSKSAIIDGIRYFVKVGYEGSPSEASVIKKHDNYGDYHGDINIPSSITVYDEMGEQRSILVTSIGNSAFYGCWDLTSISIPSSVEEIGDRAFIDCTSLTSITIPKSVRKIGKYSFENCI